MRSQSWSIVFSWFKDGSETGEECKEDGKWRRINDVLDWTDFRCLVMKTAMRLVSSVCRQDVKTTRMNIKPALVSILKKLIGY